MVLLLLLLARVIGQAALTGLHRWIVHDIVDECEEEDEVIAFDIALVGGVAQI